MDLRLTGGSGMDVLAGPAQSSRPVITIVLMNYSSAVIREACLSAGANYFFDKTNEFNFARDVIKSIACSIAAKHRQLNRCRSAPGLNELAVEA